MPSRSANGIPSKNASMSMPPGRSAGQVNLRGRHVGFARLDGPVEYQVVCDRCFVVIGAGRNSSKALDRWTPGTHAALLGRRRSALPPSGACGVRVRPAASPFQSARTLLPRPAAVPGGLKWRARPQPPAVTLSELALTELREARRRKHRRRERSEPRGAQRALRPERARAFKPFPVPIVREIRGESPRLQSWDESDHTRHYQSSIADRGLMES